jgi:RNAse (barnase) inhibitor barstar
MKKIVLHGTKMTNHEALHDELASQLMAPDYYGHNLDALWDIISTLGPTEITFQNPDEVSKADYTGLMQVLLSWAKLDDNNCLKLTSDAAVTRGHYRHFKGGYYQVTGLGIDSTDLHIDVIYRADKIKGPLWNRPLTEWKQMVKVNGQEQPRFKRI